MPLPLPPCTNPAATTTNTTTNTTTATPRHHLRSLPQELLPMLQSRYWQLSARLPHHAFLTAASGRIPPNTPLAVAEVVLSIVGEQTQMPTCAAV